MNAKQKEALAGRRNHASFRKGVMLQTLDELWKEHLPAMDYLRQGIHLRGYAQKIQNKSTKESFRMFTEMLDSLKHHDDYDTYSSEGPYHRKRLKKRNVHARKWLNVKHQHINL